MMKKGNKTVLSIVSVLVVIIGATLWFRADKTSDDKSGHFITESARRFGAVVHEQAEDYFLPEINKKRTDFEPRQERAFALNNKRAVIHLPIANSADLQKEAYAIGEKHLAGTLAAALTKAGIETRLYSFEDLHGNKNYLNKFEIYMREVPELSLPDYHEYFDKDKISVLFETFPYKPQLIKNADVVFTGSKKKNKVNREMGINSYFVPQFTDFNKFYPAYKEELRRPVLYVANQWWNMPTRKAVVYAKEQGVALDVFGANWANDLTGQYASWHKGEQIANNELLYYYSSADIVLNDTRPDMVEAGFVPNRIFDATACKAFVISDYIPEIEEIYGDAIPMYKNAEEFKRLIEYYLAHPEERLKKAEKAYRITKERYGADKVVKEIAAVLKKEGAQAGNKVKQVTNHPKQAKEKTVALRISSPKDVLDYDLSSVIALLEERLKKAGYTVKTAYAGNLYPEELDDAGLNIYVRAFDVFFDERLNKNADNIYFLPRFSNIYATEMRNFDGYMTSSRFFANVLHSLQPEAPVALFPAGYVLHQAILPTNQYDLLYIYERRNIDFVEKAATRYDMKIYAGIEFMRLSDDERKALLAGAKGVIYDSDIEDGNDEDYVPYAVYDLISYGRPLIAENRGKLKEIFGTDVLLFKNTDELSEQVETLMGLSDEAREAKGRGAREKIIHTKFQ